MHTSIVEAINELKIGQIKELVLFDIYSGKHIPRGHKGLTFAAVYRSDDKTLTDEEVNELHQQVLAHLQDKLRVTVRK